MASRWSHLLVRGLEPDGKQFDTVVPSNWVRGKKIFWAVGIHARRQYKQCSEPDDSFQQYQLVKILLEGDEETCNQFTPSTTEVEDTDDDMQHSKDASMDAWRKSSSSSKQVQKEKGIGKKRSIQYRSRTPEAPSNDGRRGRSPHRSPANKRARSSPSKLCSQSGPTFPPLKRPLLSPASSFGYSRTSTVHSPCSSLPGASNKVAHSTPQPPSHCKECNLSDHELIHKVVVQVAKMTQSISNLEAKLDVIQKSCSSEDAGKLPDNFDQMEDMEDFDELEEKLASKRMQKRLIGFMQRLGGRNYKDHTKNIMITMMTNGLMSSFNFKGVYNARMGQKKRPFEPTRLKSAVCEAVMLTNKADGQATVENITQVIKMYLKYAPGRVGGSLNPSKKQDGARQPSRGGAKAKGAKRAILVDEEACPGEDEGGVGDEVEGRMQSEGEDSQEDTDDDDEDHDDDEYHDDDEDHDEEDIIRNSDDDDI